MFEELWKAASPGNPPGGRVFGAVIGVVKENWNEKKPGMVKVEYFLGEKGQMVSGWSPVASFYTAPNGGAYFLPEVGTSVVILFEGGSPDCPIVVGSLWGKNAAFPDKAPQDKNPVKAIITKKGVKITISEEEGKESLSIATPGGLTISLEDEEKKVEIQDKDKKNAMILESGEGELKLYADKKVTVFAGGTEAITIEKDKVAIKSGTVSVEGSQKLTMKGQTANIQGSQIQIKADASMKLESGGLNEVKGSMVKLN